MVSGTSTRRKASSTPNNAKSKSVIKVYDRIKEKQTSTVCFSFIHYSSSIRQIFLVGLRKIYLRESFRDDYSSQNADDGGAGQARNANVAEMQRTAFATVADTDGQRYGEGRDDKIARVGQVNLVLDQAADTNRRNHTVQYQRNAAYSGRRHSIDKRSKLRREAEYHCDNGSDADNARVENARQVEHTRILTVGGIGRSTEERSQYRGSAVTHQSAVQTRVLKVVAIGRRADGANVANVLNHSCQRNGHNSNDGSKHKVKMSTAKGRKTSVLPLERKANPSSLADDGAVHLTGAPRPGVGPQENEVQQVGEAGLLVVR